MKRPEQVITKEIAGERIYKDAEKIEANDNEQSIIGWGSRPTADRDKELILSSAWKLDNYKKNPVLLLSHKYDIPPVGKVIWIKNDSNGLKFKAKFANTDRGKEMYQLYKEGIMGAFSVGFTPNKNGYVDSPQEKEYQGLKRVYKDVELLEISCVAVPANADALVEFVKSGKVINKQLKEELEQVIEIVDGPVQVTDDVVKDIDDAVEVKSEEKIEEKIVEEEKVVGTIEVKLDGETFDKLQEQLENMNQVIKLLADKVEVLETEKEIKIESKEDKEVSCGGSKIGFPDEVEVKVYSTEGMPSIYDIMSACNRALRRMSEDQEKMNMLEPMNPSGYVVDLFPSAYPDGSMVYCVYEEGKSCYYNVDYKYDMMSKEVEINTSPESVQQSWVTDKYNNEKDFDDMVFKEGRILSGKNRKLVSDCVEMLNGLLDMSMTKFEDDEDIEEKDYDIDEDDIDLEDEVETKSEDDGIEIDEEALTNALTEVTKNFASNFKTNEIVNNAFKKIRGKVN